MGIPNLDTSRKSRAARILFAVTQLQGLFRLLPSATVAGGNVMFSQTCVKNSVLRGEVYTAPPKPGRHPPAGRHPLLPQAGRHPLWQADTPWQTDTSPGR